MKRQLIICLLIAFTAFANIAGMQAQAPDSLRLHSLRTKLDDAMRRDSLYAGKMDFTVSNMPVNELVKSIAQTNGLNIHTGFGMEQQITCSFKQIRIADLLYFICKEYALDVETDGNILSIIPYHPPVMEPEIRIDYAPTEQEVSFDFSGAKLADVTRKFAEKTGTNVIIPENLSGKRVTSFGKSMTIENAVQSIAATNSLTTLKKDETTWMLFQEEEREGGLPLRNRFSFRPNELDVDSLGLITAHITNGNINTIVPGICGLLKKNYFLTADMNHTTGIQVEKVDLDTFLRILFTGTDFTWRIEEGIYLFARNNGTDPFSSVKVLPMKYRTVEKVTEIIPATLKKGVEILVFPELNSLVVSGDRSALLRLSTFIADIDRSVPLISIDVIIVDASDTSTREAGIRFGKGKEPSGASQGTFSPGLDLSLSASTINRLLNSFSDFTSVNLGKVGPNFYAGLKLLEENDIVTLRSTPKLSTLNGHKATLKSGEMRYYKESQTNFIGTQNPLQTNSYQWKNVEANMTLEILPYVSLDSCITLKVDLSQSEFTEQVAEDAPPGTTNRSFNSIIRVRNQEMVLLGGIERNLTGKTSSGLPFIARIPVLRWIFGYSSRTKKVQKLNVFIKPTII